MFRKTLLALLLCVPAAAQASWLEASSRHFRVYSEGGEDSLRKAITDLEKYDFVLRWASKVTRPASPIKLKVYLLRNTAEVSQSMPFAPSGVAGYYTASARGPIAVSTRTGTGGQDELSAQGVLFHEYAHHFMFQYFPATYPAWYSEGFAEYYGTTRILDKDVIEVGHAARHRYSSFEDNSWMPVGRMLAAKSYADVGGDLYLMYAQGWLLVHYLSFQKERSGQLAAYLNAINAGVPYEKARDDAFGPGAKKLDAELRDYSGKHRLTALSLPFKPIDVGPIELRPLDEAENALIDEDIALGGGLPRTLAAKFAERVRSKAARYSSSPYALRILVEAERAAGNNAAAQAAVDRWLTLKPKDGLAMMHKAQLQIDSLAAAKSTDPAAWDGARSLIVQASKASPGTPEILLAYYNSFVRQGVAPPAGAQNALVRAFELVPQDEMLRYLVAADFENRGMIQEAVATIKPVAFELHGSDENAKKKKKEEELREKYRVAGDTRTETPREMLERLEKKLAQMRPAGQSRDAAQTPSGS
jgi:Flp pilus assembly protein TadD